MDDRRNRLHQKLTRGQADGVLHPRSRAGIVDDVSSSTVVDNNSSGGDNDGRVGVCVGFLPVAPGLTRWRPPAARTG